MFEIHPQLQKDCLVLGRFELSYLLLVNDSTFPWFILVPARQNIIEIYQLSERERNLLWQESNELSEWIMRQFAGDKLNVAAIGNLVPQLHLHHIVRYRSDPAWPEPVWGKFPLRPYHDDALMALKDRMKLDRLLSRF
jgi:diadenosine tetraphosphate (Ap4A) HIT family hydrolase